MHVLLLGVGLIGGSWVLALRRAGLIKKVTGIGRQWSNLHKAQQLGIIDDAYTSIADVQENIDAVIVAVPLGAYQQVFQQLSGVLSKHTIVTDVGSSKQHALAMARAYLPATTPFIAGHPIAGTEHSGAAAAFASLFDGQLCLLTPDAHTDQAALAKVRQWWQAVGATVRCMDAEKHDLALASVSHLPHLAAYALVNTVAEQVDADCDPFTVAAGGFRDVTRVASSSPEMWRDIALCNRVALLQQLQCYQAQLGQLETALKAADSDALLAAFSAAKEQRDRWLRAQQEQA